MPGPWDPPDSEPVLARTRFRITVADVTAAWRAHLRWRYTRPSTMVFPVLAGLGLMALDTAWNPGSGALLLVPLAGMPTLAVAIRLCQYALVPLLARRTYRQTRAYQEEWLVELTPSGARASTPSTSNFVPWSHYVAWSEASRVILLYHSDMLFQFVPRPAVDTAAMQVFRGLMAGVTKR